MFIQQTRVQTILFMLGVSLSLFVSINFATTANLEHDKNSIETESEATFQIEPDMMCGPRCLWQIARAYHKNPTLNGIAYKAGTTSTGGTTLKGMVRAGQDLGLNAIVVKTNLASLAARDVPVAILLLKINKINHYVILDSIKKGSVSIIDGAARKTINSDDLKRIWSGYAILLGDFQENKLVPAWSMCLAGICLLCVAGALLLKRLLSAAAV
jgi:hypothetical protein